MKYTYAALCALAGLITLCYAESFIIEEKQKRPQPNHQMKQEIVDLMGRIAELESESIKTKAEIQKAVCTKIRGYIAGDKESFFAVASRKDLQRVLTLLRQENESLAQAIGADKKLLETLSNPLIV